MPRGVAKAKPDKDPNKPKRPMSAYLFFTQAKRQEAKDKGKPVKNVAEWTTAVSKIWKALSEDEAEKYHAMAADAKEDYDEAMKKYNSMHGGGGKAGKSGAKKTKAPGEPKKPLTAYFLFLADFRRDNKDVYENNAELLKAAGAEWKSLTAQERKPYEDQAGEEKKNYVIAKRSFDAKARNGTSSSGASSAKKARTDDDDDDDDDEEEEEEDEEEEEEEEDDE